MLSSQFQYIRLPRTEQASQKCVRSITCPKKSISTLSLDDDQIWGSSQQVLYERMRRKIMAKKYQAPMYVLLGNMLTTALLRVGFKLMGFGRYPMYLLTVRGRKSGQLRTVSMAIIEQDGKSYLNAPFGVVPWVRNLRA